MPPRRVQLKKSFAGIFLLIVLVSSPVGAQWWSGDRQVPDEPWRRGKGDFGAMLLLTTDADAFYAEWLKPEAPTIKITDVARRGIPITAVILFTGCRAVEGKCDVRVDFTVLEPDGSEYGLQKDVSAWKDKPAAPKGVVQLSEGSLGIRIEPDDPNGEYLVKARVRDVNGKVDIELEQPFTVSE